MKKHILCLGDSNTHGYCADPADCADGGTRFNEEERWTCLLQNALGSNYLVTEEGLSGRTTVFPDPLHETMDALTVLYSLLKSHEVIDLLIIMLGTNDAKERLGVNAACIGIGMERLVRKAQSVDCWGCDVKTRELPQYYRKTAGLVGAHFIDAAQCEFNQIDHMHLTRKGHTQLAAMLAEQVPALLPQ